MDENFSENVHNFSERFFETLDDRLEREKQDCYRFQIKICEHIIELRFPSKKQAEWVEKNLVGQIIYEKGTPGAVFQFWSEDTACYVGEENASKDWEYKDETGHIWSIAGRYLIGVNAKSKTFYYCSSKRDIRCYWEIPLIYRWARMEDMLVVHGAVVGAGGKGVLIAAQGGGGKSTLSVSCLLEGMDFVSDDHFLVNEHGPLRAMPIYKTVKLNVDMAKQIKPDMPVIWSDDIRGGKQTMDASGYTFCRELPVHAILFPKVTEREEPVILPTALSSGLNEFIHSTMIQYTIFDYREASRRMLLRFYKMPAYEIQLTKNLKKNVELLRRFIEREI